MAVSAVCMSYQTALTLHRVCVVHQHVAGAAVSEPEYDARLVLQTQTVTAWDVACQGSHRGMAAEERVAETRGAFPYRGVYVHSVGSKETVADANRMMVINADEPYRVSHPVPGGDATFT